jgi:predicted DNA-binding transcriptional regulator AlpA
MHWETATIRVPAKPFLTIGEVATVVGYNRKTINRWIKEGAFPAPITIDGVRRWTAMSVGVWMAWKEYGPKGAGDEETPTKHPAGETQTKGK